MHYTSTKGKIVNVTITEHAIRRFTQRANALWPGRKLENPLSVIETEFANSVREDTDAKLAQRMKRHGKDTIYFRNNSLRFVVQNGAIVTIEIRGKRRDLN